MKENVVKIKPNKKKRAVGKWTRKTRGKRITQGNPNRKPWKAYLQ